MNHHSKPLNNKGIAYHTFVVLLAIVVFAAFSAYRVYNSAANQSPLGKYAVKVDTEKGCKFAGRVWDDKKKNPCLEKCRKSNVQFIKQQGQQEAYCKGYVATTIDENRCLNSLHRYYLKQTGCVRKSDQENDNKSNYCQEAFPNYVAEQGMDRCTVATIAPAGASNPNNQTKQPTDKLDKSTCLALGRTYNDTEQTCNRVCSPEAGTLLIHTDKLTYYCHLAMATDVPENRCGELHRRWLGAGCARNPNQAKDTPQDTIRCLAGYPYYKVNSEASRRGALDVCERNQQEAAQNESAGVIGNQTPKNDDEPDVDGGCADGSAPDPDTSACPEDDITEQPPQTDDLTVDPYLDQQTCILLGRLWVPGSSTSEVGCSLEKCFNSAPRVISNNGKPFCEGYAEKLTRARCDSVHRRWVDQADVCAAHPSSDKQVIVSAPQCRAPYTSYVFPSKGTDECLKPSTVERLRSLAQSVGKPFSFIASLPPKAICKLRDGMVWQNQRCIKQPTAQKRLPVTATFSFQNLGREEASATAVFQKIKHGLSGRPNVIYNFAEIDEGDHGEHAALKAVFGNDGWSGFNTRVPTLSRLDKDWKVIGSETVRLHNNTGGGSGPERVLVVTRYQHVKSPTTKFAVINTHFVANAYNGGHSKRLQVFWDRAWSKLRDKVGTLHEHNYDVVVIGDLNRKGGFPNLHSKSRIMLDVGPDTIFTIPATGRTVTKNATGNIDTPNGEGVHQNIWANLTFKNK